jgi:nucleotide-binding universal stress UspA family protein
MGVMPPTETQEERAELRETFASEWCAPLRNSGVRFRGIVEEGAPAGTALIAVGVREGADMIVVGSRGLNAVTEFLLGSISHQVAHHSAIPVVIVSQPVRVRVEAKPQLTEPRQPALLPVF